MLHRDSENGENGGPKREPSERLIWLAAFAAAVTVVGVGLYFIFRNAASIAALSITRPATPSVQAASPASTASLPEPKSSISPEANNIGATVYRCVVDDTATYSDAPCRGGTAVDAGQQQAALSCNVPALRHELHHQKQPCRTPLPPTRLEPPAKSPSGKHAARGSTLNSHESMRWHGKVSLRQCKTGSAKTGASWQMRNSHSSVRHPVH